MSKASYIIFFPLAVIILYFLEYCFWVLFQITLYHRNVRKNVLQTLYILRELFTVKNLFAVSCLKEQENVKMLQFIFVL